LVAILVAVKFVVDYAPRLSRGCFFLYWDFSFLTTAAFVFVVGCRFLAPCFVGPMFSLASHGFVLCVVCTGFRGSSARAFRPQQALGYRHSTVLLSFLAPPLKIRNQLPCLFESYFDGQ